MYTPVFEGPVQGYAANYLNKQLWRLQRTHDREDCMQEAYLVFHKCQTQYPTLDTPEHFMALFKTALMRRVHDLSTKNTAQAQFVNEAGLGSDDGGEELASKTERTVGALDNDGFLSTLVRQAPDEVRMVCALFLNAPQELLEMALSGWQAVNYKSHGDAVVSRLLGLGPSAAPMTRTLEYFTQD